MRTEPRAIPTPPALAERFIFTCEHASAQIPAGWKKRLNIPASVLSTHRAWDPGAEQLMESLFRENQQEADLYLGEYSRLLVDLNRSESKRGVWSEWSRRLSAAEKAEVLTCYYRPWRQRVADRIRDLIDQGSPVGHLSFHSFTPVWKGVARLTDIGILYDPARGQEAVLARAIISSLRIACPELTIHANRPYLGISDGHVTALRREFAEPGYTGIEIEINQRLIKDWQVSGLLKRLSQTLSKL